MKKVLCSMGVAFRELPVGRSRWRLAQSHDRGLRGSAHCGYCVHGSHLLPMDHGRQHPGTPATRCATSFIPVAVSLLNAPPTATPSSVMGPKSTAPRAVTLLLIEPDRCLPRHAADVVRPQDRGTPQARQNGRPPSPTASARADAVEQPYHPGASERPVPLTDLTPEPFPGLLVPLFLEGRPTRENTR